MRGALTIVLIVASQVVGQQAETRYELGKRVQAFEIAWDTKANDADAKKRVAPVVNQAVQNFFRFNFPAVGQTMDQARHLLRSAEEVPANVRWAEAFYAVPEARLLDGQAKEHSVALKAFYKLDLPTPKNALVRVQLGQAKPTEVPFQDVPFSIKFPLGGTPSGDTTLVVTIEQDGKTLAKHTFAVAVVDKLDARLKALQDAVAKLPSPRTTIEQATLAQHVKLLTALAQKAPQETDYPAARLLAEAEELVPATGAIFTAKRAGEYWLSVPTGKTNTSVRLRVPEKLGERVPVVVALHGMGGSENMFFDAYGNGIVPKLARERGWLVVATRVEGVLGAGPAPAVPALLDELQKRYPIDTKRVFLVGHSMGAGHVIQLTTQNPERFAAVAALGGGGRITKPEPLHQLPFFVGCGKLDFALGGAKSLAKSLEGGKVTFKEYDDIEHLVIVREAAPEVFQFFDKVK